MSDRPSSDFADIFGSLQASLTGIYGTSFGLAQQQAQMGGTFSTSNAWAIGPPPPMPSFPPEFYQSPGVIQDPVLESERDWLHRRVREITALAPRR